MLKKLFITMLFATSVSAPTLVFAKGDSKSKDKSMGERIESGYEKTKDVTKEAYEDAKDGTKKAYRKVQDETCEMINGKMECTVNKANNKMKNAYDSAKDKSNDPVRR